MVKLLSLIFALICLPAFAQNLPFHADPSARQDAPDLSGVPAIRFLTTPDFPPFNYRDGSGQLVGFNVDLANEICKTLTISCTMQSWPWTQAANALADNQGDALIAGLAIDAETAQRFDFSDLYLEFPARFVTVKGAVADFDLGTLGEKTIAVRSGSAHAQFLADYVPDVQVQGFDTEIAALQAMRDGKTDAYFGDAMRASFWMNDHIECCAFVGEPYFNARLFGEGLAVAVPAGRGSVRAAINYALQKLKREGKLDELYLRWFPVSFY